jgi:hypothetical protein
MLPANQALITEALTGIGNSKASTGDEAEYHFLEENENLKSFCIVSTTNKDYIAAGTILNSRKTMRIGDPTGRPTGSIKTIRFWQRATAPKLYFTSMYDKDLVAGDTYSWGGQIAVANIKNIYDYVK